MALQKFRNYLVSKGFVIESQLPYDIKWVEAFYIFVRDRPTLPGLYDVGSWDVVYGCWDVFTNCTYHIMSAFDRFHDFMRRGGDMPRQAELDAPGMLHCYYFARHTNSNRLIVPEG
jgi:hypothetical protein